MNRTRHAAPFGLWMFLFTVVPLGMVCYFAFTNENGAFTFDNLARFPEYSKSFWYSLEVGSISTLLCLILAYPLAFSISRRSERAQRTLILLVMLPMWMNSLLRITALKYILYGNGFLNRILSTVGLPTQHILGTTSAIVLGTVFDFLPFLVLPLYSVMTKIDNRLLEVAQDLGASAPHVLFRVVLPLSVPGIVSGITMVFVPSVSSFIISRYLGSAQTTTMIGETIEFLFKDSAPPFYNVGSMLSLLLMLLMLLCMAVMGRVDKDDDMEGMMV